MLGQLHQKINKKIFSFPREDLRVKEANFNPLFSRDITLESQLSIHSFVFLSVIKTNQTLRIAYISQLVDSIANSIVNSTND